MKIVLDLGEQRLCVEADIEEILEMTDNSHVIVHFLEHISVGGEGDLKGMLAPPHPVSRFRTVVPPRATATKLKKKKSPKRKVATKKK